MGKPMYKVGSVQYKKNRVADGSIIRISADLRGSPMEVFKQLKETLGCGATGVIVHLIENYQPPMSSSMSSPISTPTLYIVSPSEDQTR